jgi:hypothetical protein
MRKSINDYSINPAIKNIDFENITLQTLDFNTPFPIEYTYNVWKHHHPIYTPDMDEVSIREVNEKYRRIFYRFLQLYFKQYIVNATSPEYQTESALHSTNFDVIKASEPHTDHKFLFIVRLFTWYTPEIINILAPNDLDVVVLCKNKSILSKLPKPYRVDPNFQPVISRFNSMYLYNSSIATMTSYIDFLLFVSQKIINPQLNFYIYIDPTLSVDERLPLFQRQEQNITRMRDTHGIIIDSKLENFIINDEATSFRDWINANGLFVSDDMLEKTYKICPYPHDDMLYRLRDLSLLDLATFYKANNIIHFLLSNHALPSKNAIILAATTNNFQIFEIFMNILNNKSYIPNPLYDIPSREFILYSTISYNSMNTFNHITMNYRINDESYSAEYEESLLKLLNDSH